MSLLGCLAITEGYIVAYLATNLQKESYTIAIDASDGCKMHIIHCMEGSVAIIWVTHSNRTIGPHRLRRVRYSIVFRETIKSQ